MNKNLLFRSIPKVDILLEEQEIQNMIDVYGREFVMDVIREEMDALRTFIGKCEEEEKLFGTCFWQVPNTAPWQLKLQHPSRNIHFTSLLHF